MHAYDMKALRCGPDSARRRSDWTAEPTTSSHSSPTCPGPTTVGEVAVFAVESTGSMDVFRNRVQATAPSAETIAEFPDRSHQRRRQRPSCCQGSPGSSRVIVESDGSLP